MTVGSARAADEEARVLILNGTDPYLPAYLAIDSAMRASLAEEPGRRIVYFSEPLDAQRFQVEAYEPELIALLARKYSGLRFDVVVAISRRALEFFNRHGAQLWPGARLVFSGWPGEALESSELPPGASGGRHATGNCGDDRRSRAACSLMRGAFSSSPERRISTGETSNWCGSRSRRCRTACPSSSWSDCRCRTSQPDWPPSPGYDRHLPVAIPRQGWPAVHASGGPARNQRRLRRTACMASSKPTWASAWWQDLRNRTRNVARLIARAHP